MSEENKAKVLDILLYQFFKRNGMIQTCVLQAYFFKRIIPSCVILKKFKNIKIDGRQFGCRFSCYSSLTHYQIKVGEKIFDPAGRSTDEITRQENGDCFYQSLTDFPKYKHCKVPH